MVLSGGLKVVSSSPSEAFAVWRSETWTPPALLDVLEEFEAEVFEEPVFEVLPLLALPLLLLVLPTLKLQARPAKTRSARASRPEWILIRGFSFSCPVNCAEGFTCDEGSKQSEVARVVPEFVHGRLKDERGLGEARLARDPCERLGPDLAEADVPVAVNARIIGRLRVVEVYSTNISEAHIFFERFKSGRKPVLVAQVVARGEGVRRVEADAEVQAGALLSNLAQVLEAVADALALTRRVLKQDSERAKFDSLARGLQTLGARPNPVGLARAARAAGMDDEVVRAESNPALDLFAERGDRLLADCIVRRGEVDEVVRVDDDGRNSRLRAHALERLDLFRFERASLPPARVARVDLHRVRAERPRLEQSILQAARDACVKTDPRVRRIHAAV